MSTFPYISATSSSFERIPLTRFPCVSIQYLSHDFLVFQSNTSHTISLCFNPIPLTRFPCVSIQYLLHDFFKFQTNTRLCSEFKFGMNSSEANGYRRLKLLMLLLPAMMVGKKMQGHCCCCCLGGGGGQRDARMLLLLCRGVG